MTGGAAGQCPVHTMAATKQSREVLNPHPKLTRRYARRIVTRLVQDAKDTICQELGNRACHASEPVHEKGDRITAVQVERRASSLSGISPRVEMVQPLEEQLSEQD
jgi:hypothetical protein